MTASIEQTKLGARGIVKGLSYSALVIFCLITSPASSEEQWKQSKFVLGTFYDPPLSGNNTTQDTVTLQTARAAYFNLLSGFEWPQPGTFQDVTYRLELADSVNFKLLIYDDRFTGTWNYSPFSQTVATDVTNNYTTLSRSLRRAVFGYQIGDEPLPPLYVASNAQRDAIKQWIGHFTATDPSKLAYVNLLPFFPWDVLFPDREDINGNGQCDAQIQLTDPNWPRDGQEIDLDGGGCTTVGEQLRVGYYQLYLSRIVDGPDKNQISDILSYDHYPFVLDPSAGVVVRNTYFYNLSLVRQAAGTRPFWTYPLSTGHDPYVNPEATHLRFMAFSPIAYGAMGLIYYTYSAVPLPGYVSALIDDQKKYQDVQQINHYIRDVVGPVVMNSVHVGAFHKAVTPSGQIIPDNERLTSDNSLIADINNDDILVGVFRDALNIYLLLVNKSLDPTPLLTVTLKGDWRDKVELAPSVLTYREGDAYASRATSYDPATKQTRFAVPAFAGGEGRLVRITAPRIFADFVGDQDNFHAGDVADVARRSVWLIGTLGAIAGNPGYLPGVGLDVGGANRPVGLTHVLPTNAVITSAKVRFRLRAEDPLVHNDTILYDESASQGPGQPFLPFIALRDLLGREPQQGEIPDIEMDLSRVPIRTRDTSGGPGGHLSPDPDEYRNLLPLLAAGEFNLIFLDDVAVDYSELRVIYADAQSLVTFEALKPAAPPSTKDTTDCPVEFAGKYSFDALLTNISGMALSNLRVGIQELSNENLLLTADKERLEASEWFEVPATDGYVDQKLEQGETVTVPFTVCLKASQPFRLFVNVVGVAQ